MQKRKRSAGPSASAFVGRLATSKITTFQWKRKRGSGGSGSKIHRFRIPAWKYCSVLKASSNINGILTFWECGVWPLTMTWTFLDEYSLFQEIKNVLGPLVLRLDNVVLNYDHIWISLSLISFNSLLFFRMAKNVYNWVKSSRTVLGTIFAALQFFRFPWCPTSLWHFGGSLEYGEGSYRFRLPTYPYDDQTSHLSVFTQKMTLTKSPVLLALVMKAFRDSRSTRN